ncbi:hypothetical protein V6C42_12925 [Pseudoclostridium thermosuccinogenes]|uniref:hypothetical protein n=1 Tax=Clostridium thermosuccinogenes TaxID=84032 RepID=UPI002FDA5049
MSDLKQIICTSLIVFMMMFAAAAILDRKYDKDTRTQLVIWSCTWALIISKIIW